MDILWSPWRSDYVSGDKDPAGCVFCNILNSSASDEEQFILKRAEFNFVILNRYPYAPAHVMVVPFDHLATLDEAGKQTTDEMMDLVKSVQAAIYDVYSPDGLNLGMNLGKAGGAGVDSHIHMHLLPRWIGDVNFMTAIGETRTISESLDKTYEKLKGKI